MNSEIKKALQFAYKVHQTDQFQVRKGKDIPYLLHPLSVANRLSRIGARTEVIIAGMLHDTIEDSIEEKKVTKEEIEREFGANVAEMVNDVTEQDKSLPWTERKEAALNHIKNMKNDSLLVKTADVLDNLTDQIEDYKKIGERMFENYNASKEAQLIRYLRLVEEVEKAWGANPLLSDLKNAVTEVKRLWG
ncbi:MAG TPA: HD domain-containing protein [Candidatus Saccharimonadales bacterium]|nr:HD domain-containing protein [Candidatus Saccharimonadales bacterium]